MTKLQFAKDAASLVVGASTARVVGQIIRNNTDVETVTDQVATMAAAFALGGMAADAAKEYTDAQIEKAADWYRKNLKKDA